MKLKPEFIIHTTAEGMLMISTGGFNGMVKSNKTAADIIECLRDGAAREQIIAKMTEKYDADPATLAADTDAVIETLRKIGAIDD